MVELHDHIGAEVALDLHHDLGRKKAARAIDVRLELDTLLIDGPELREREDLEAARVGEDWAIPAHELVQPAHLAYDVVAGPEVEMIRIAEDHGRAHADEIVGIEGFHG